MAAERLQKVLASVGVASRRASEGLIAAGRVTVDGKTAVVGQQVDPDKAVILVDGRPIGTAANSTYLLLHKPAGVTSTTRDRHAATTVMDLVPTALVPDGARLYPVGRLDQDSEGLLILTNDGAWSERVLHPRYGVEREYAVGVAWPLTHDQQAALAEGIQLEEGVATIHNLRVMSEVEVGRVREVLDPPAPAGLDLVPGRAPTGLEAPAPPDVRRGRGPDRAARPDPDRPGPHRRAPVRSDPAAQGAGGPRPGGWRRTLAQLDRAKRGQVQEMIGHGTAAAILDR